MTFAYPEQAQGPETIGRSLQTSSVWVLKRRLSDASTTRRLEGRASTLEDQTAQGENRDGGHSSRQDRSIGTVHALKMRAGRVFLVYLLIGALLGVVIGLLRKLTGIDSGLVGGAIIGGGLVALGPILNLLARSGHVPWLVQHD
jgi:hypothetical protein